MLLVLLLNNVERTPAAACSIRLLPFSYACVGPQRYIIMAYSAISMSFVSIQVPCTIPGNSTLFAPLWLSNAYLLLARKVTRKKTPLKRDRFTGPSRRKAARDVPDRSPWLVAAEACTEPRSWKAEREKREKETNIHVLATI